jgi:diadenosine tetraphosphate (Ap4A) HIT family hydrolase
MKCLSCQSLKGETSLSRGPAILKSKYWQVEHIHPTSLLGWLVIVLKRHAEALHELSSDEFSELARIQEATTKALHEETKCQKEYNMIFAEQENFNHVHVHIVPIPEDLPAKNRGPNIFSLHGVPDSEVVDDKKTIKLCKRLSNKISLQ